MQRVSSQVAGAMCRVGTARTIPEVVQAAHVTAGPIFRSLRHLFPDLKRLDAATNRKLDELLQAQLAAIAAAGSAEDAGTCAGVTSQRNGRRSGGGSPGSLSMPSGKASGSFTAGNRPKPARADLFSGPRSTAPTLSLTGWVFSSKSTSYQLTTR